MEIPKNELIKHLPYPDYAAIPALRAGDLKQMHGKSPRHLQVARKSPDNSTGALAFGKLFHLALECPERFRATYVVEPEFTGKTKDGRDSTRSAAAREAKESWYSENAGKPIVARELERDLLGMIESVLSHKRLGAMLKDGISESTLVVTDPETGIDLKCRPDFITPRGHILDLKTTRNASRGFFTAQIFSDRGQSPFYALQAAHYTHCMKVAKIGHPDLFVIAAIEKEEPWGIMLYPLDTGGIDVGEAHRAHLTREYAKALSSGVWPCYSEDFETVSVPQYAKWVEYGE